MHINLEFLSEEAAEQLAKQAVNIPVVYGFWHDDNPPIGKVVSTDINADEIRFVCEMAPNILLPEGLVRELCLKPVYSNPPNGEPKLLSVGLMYRRPSTPRESQGL